jgi:hypothetical protein
MHPSPATAAIPGARIPNYRNSSQRAIRLVGLGAAASALVSCIARRGLPNVSVTIGDIPIGWPAVTAATDRALNMIVIVCHEGDAHLFRPLAGRPDVLVTFVLLQATSHPLVPQDPAFAPELERARACCDLFVTTSDGDYVAELIDNLAS